MSTMNMLSATLIALILATCLALVIGVRAAHADGGATDVLSIDRTLTPTATATFTGTATSTVRGPVRTSYGNAAEGEHEW